MKIILLILAVLFINNICYGQEVNTINFEYSYKETPYISLNHYLITPKIQDTYKFGGLYKVAIDRINGLLRRYQNSYYSDSLQGNHKGLLDWERRHSASLDLENDIENGRWWERPLLDSFVSENGGISYKTVHIGRDIDLIRFKGLSFNTSGRLSFEYLDFDLFSLRPPFLKKDVGSLSIRDVTDNELSIRAILPWQNIISSNSLKVTFQQNIVLRAVWPLEKSISRVDIGLTIKLYDSPRNVNWASINLRFKASPPDKQYEFQAVFRLVNF